MKTTYECSKCGIVSADREHLCAPEQSSGYCGVEVEKATSMCTDMGISVSHGCSETGIFNQRERDK